MTEFNTEFEIKEFKKGRYIFSVKSENGNQLRVLNIKRNEKANIEIAWGENDLLQLREDEYDFDRFCISNKVFVFQEG